MNITITVAAVLAIIIIIALLGYSAMTRSAKVNPEHWFHS